MPQALELQREREREKISNPKKFGRARLQTMLPFWYVWPNWTRPRLSCLQSIRFYMTHALQGLCCPLGPALLADESARVYWSQPARKENHTGFLWFEQDLHWRAQQLDGRPL